METNSSIIAKWRVDPIHSNLFFKAKHLMISIVMGQIKSFELEVQTSGNDFGEVTDLTLKADMTSLTTNHKPRDENLMSHDFFDVTNHPYLTFQSTLFDKQGIIPPTFMSVYRRDFKLHGMLTIKGISKMIILDGDFGGLSKDHDGQKRAGFTIRGKISRREFGLDTLGAMDSGKHFVADEVEIIGNIQLIKQILDVPPTIIDE